MDLSSNSCSEPKKQGGEEAVTEAGQPLRRDFGLDQILADPGQLRRAIEGAVVLLRLELMDIDRQCYDVAPENLKAALFEKSYEECANLRELQDRQRQGERGVFFIDERGKRCYLVYSHSPYPLNFLACRENGDAALVDAAVAGFSNNAGCDVAGLAKDLVKSGFSEGLLLSNGAML